MSELKHAVRALRGRPSTPAAEPVPRKRRYNAAIRDAVTALWEASDRVPSKLDPHLATIEDWLAAEPQITALAILRRLAAIDPDTRGTRSRTRRGPPYRAWPSRAPPPAPRSAPGP